MKRWLRIVAQKFIHKMTALTQETLTFIIGIGTILSLIFGYYNSIKKPQQKGEVVDARFDERFNALKDIVINLRDNHLHTIETKLDDHIKENHDYCIKQAEQYGKILGLLEQVIKK